MENAKVKSSQKAFLLRGGRCESQRAHSVCKHMFQVYFAESTHKMATAARVYTDDNPGFLTMHDS
jgi:hypothetical protein